MNHIALIAPGGADEALTEIRRRGVPGYALDVLPGDGALREPFAHRRPDLVHVWSPPVAITPGTDDNVPLVANYAEDHPASFYHRCSIVFSPHAAADAALSEIGLTKDRIIRWHPGIDVERFNHAIHQPTSEAFTVLHAHGNDPRAAALLSDALLIADNHLRRLHTEPAHHDAYATADLLVLTAADDSHASLILKAQASGLPVLAVDTPAAAELIESGRTGCLVPRDPIALAGAITGLARRATLRRRLAGGGLHAARQHSWDRSLADLAAGYARALARPTEHPHIAHAA